MTSGTGGPLRPDLRGVASPAETPTLADLFAAPALASGTPTTVRAAIDLPDGLRPFGSSSAAAAWRPRTPFEAAWLLLQRQWRGLGGRRFGLSPDATAADWLRKVDAAPAASLPAASPDELRWLAPSDGGAEAGGTDPGDADAAPRIRLVADPVPGLALEAPAALMDAAQARTVLESIVQTALELVARPESRLCDIDTLGAAQRRRLDEWNPQAAVADPAPTVHAVFRRRAAERGDAIALSWQGRHMSYADLDRRSSRLAMRLRAAQVGAGSVVCVALERSIDSIVALLGILKAGAAYLPVDVRHPAERLAFMLADASAVLVVSREAHRGAFPPGTPLLSMDAPDAQATTAGEPAESVDGGSLAYVMYTSGSTGTPKGIEICHRAILRLVVDARLRRRSGRRRAVLHAAPLGFDASTLEIWGPLLNGGRCVLHDEEVPPRPPASRAPSAPSRRRHRLAHGRAVQRRRRRRPGPSARPAPAADRRRGAVGAARAPRATPRCPA